MDAQSYYDPTAPFDPTAATEATFYGSEPDGSNADAFSDEAMFNSYVNPDFQDPSMAGLFDAQGPEAMFAPHLQTFPPTDVIAPQQPMPPVVNLAQLQNSFAQSAGGNLFNAAVSYPQSDPSIASRAPSSSNAPSANSTPHTSLSSYNSPKNNEAIDTTTNKDSALAQNPPSASATTPGQKIPKKRGRKKKIPKNAQEAEEKRNKFLERNRIAASKCREKKKEWMHDMENQKFAAERELHQNQEMIVTLTHELSQLAALAKAHMTVGCDDCELAHVLKRLETHPLMNNGLPLPELLGDEGGSQQQQQQEQQQDVDMGMDMGMGLDLNMLVRNRTDSVASISTATDPIVEADIESEELVLNNNKKPIAGRSYSEDSGVVVTPPQ